MSSSADSPPKGPSSSGTTIKLSKVGRRFSTCVPSISLTTTVSLDHSQSEHEESTALPLRRTSSHKYGNGENNRTNTSNVRSSNVRSSGQDDHECGGGGGGRNSHAARQRRMSRNHLTINWSENQGGSASTFTKRVGLASSSFDCGVGGPPMGGGSIAACSTFGSSMLLLPQISSGSRRKSFINQVSLKEDYNEVSWPL